MVPWVFTSMLHLWEAWIKLQGLRTVTPKRYEQSLFLSACWGEKSLNISSAFYKNISLQAALRIFVVSCSDSTPLTHRSVSF